jgi:integrase
VGRKEVSGLVKRGEIWHIEKRFNGQRIRETTGTDNLAEAQRYLIHRMQEIREAELYGVRPRRIFREAAIKYLSEAEKADKASVRCEAHQVELLDPFIGSLLLERVHMGTLRPFIEQRRHQKDKDRKVKARTINYGLQVVRRILNLAASEWQDERGLTWLALAPKIKLLRELDKRGPRPITWKEQLRLFNELPRYLVKMCLFAVNTGCREQEVCNLQWEWEVAVPELGTSVFIIPRERVKNREERVVILNRVAKAVVGEMRGVHPEYVFSYEGKRVSNMNNRAWKEGRERAGLTQVRIHDLKHTFGERLRAAGVSFEDRQDLLGHKSGRSITTHYSQAHLSNLIAAANKVCRPNVHKMTTLAMLRQQFRPGPSTQAGGTSS